MARLPCEVCRAPRGPGVKGIRIEGFYPEREAFCSTECLEVRVSQLLLGGYRIHLETPYRKVFRHARVMGVDPWSVNITVDGVKIIDHGVGWAKEAK